MTVFVIGCGDSANNWSNNHCDISIGMNDCEKFGKPVNHLIVVSSPKKFLNGRLDVILRSTPDVFHTHNVHAYHKWFPGAKHLNYTTFTKFIKLDGKKIYSKHSTPIMAISMAYNLGAKNIVLWGVDFESHPVFTLGSDLLKNEAFAYRQLFEAIKNKGVGVWLGVGRGVFKDDLQVWNSQQ